MKLLKNIAVLAAAACLTMNVGTFVETPVSAADTAPAEVEVIRGDVNGDGRFSVADIATVARWLLGWDVELENPDAADFCEDGVLDVFDLCLMKHELVNSSVKQNMAREDMLEIMFSRDEFTWSDFAHYKSEKVSSDPYILRYEIDMEDNENFYLYITGNTDEKPDEIYLMRSDDPFSEDDEKEDIYELKEEIENFLIHFSPPENTVKDRDTAQKLADLAFAELKKGNIAVGGVLRGDAIDDPELLKAYKESYFGYIKPISEHTVIVQFDRGGFFEVFGYLVTDGTVEYALGWNDDIDPNFDGGGVDVYEIYDNIYYFYAGT